MLNNIVNSKTSSSFHYLHSIDKPLYYTIKKEVYFLIYRYCNGFLKYFCQVTPRTFNLIFVKTLWLRVEIMYPNRVTDIPVNCWLKDQHEHCLSSVLMKRKFEQWWSSIPRISIKMNNHLTKKTMAYDVGKPGLAWDMHNNLAGLYHWLLSCTEAVYL